jgi:VIT1/CCC1 family predicted Fe2+/Mn2+ transporter
MRKCRLAGPVAKPGSSYIARPLQLVDLTGSVFDFATTNHKDSRSTMKIQSRNFSFGGAAAIVTNMGLIIGFDAATATKTMILSGLLIVAIADNLTDSLSIHIYQESEQLEPREAFYSTLTNFAARLVLSLSFVFLVWVLPLGVAVIASIVWGMLLLIGLTYIVARSRKLPVLPEIWKHIAVAAVVILSSKMIGHIVLA